MVRASQSTRRRQPTSTVNQSPLVLMQPKLETCDPPAQPIVQAKIISIAPRQDTPMTTTTTNGSFICSYCAQPIRERYLLHTEDRLCRGNYWHMQCLRCQSCDALLADVASTFYTKDNLLLCKSDYIKRYGSRPCSLCSQIIGKNEPIMRLSPTHIYHLTCFTCMKCHCPLLKGDRYVLFNGQPFCEKDNPFKTTSTNSTTTVNKRVNTTTKRATAKAARLAAQNQQTFVTSSSYHPTATGSTHFSHSFHGPSVTIPMTHSLLNPILSNNEASSATNNDDFF